MLTVLFNTAAAVNNDNGYKNLLSLIYDTKISAISLYIVGIEKQILDQQILFVTQMSKQLQIIIGVYLSTIHI